MTARKWKSKAMPTDSFVLIGVMTSSLMTDCRRIPTSTDSTPYQQWLRYRELAEAFKQYLWHLTANEKNEAVFSTGETIMHFWCGWRRVKSSGDTCILKCQLASHLSITVTKRLRQLGSTECETQYIPFYILSCLWNKRSFLKSFYSNLQELLIWAFERVFYEHVNTLSTRRYANTKKWSIPPSAMTMAQTECSNHSNN